MTDSQTAAFLMQAVAQAFSPLTLQGLARESRAVDLSPNLVSLAHERLPQDIPFCRIDFRSGDMLDASLGEFDYLVAMDSLIHYAPEQVVSALAQWAPRIRWAMSLPLHLAALCLKPCSMWEGSSQSPIDRRPLCPRLFGSFKSLLPPSLPLRGWTLTRRERVSKGFLYLGGHHALLAEHDKHA